jgi:hypothetical protein
MSQVNRIAPIGPPTSPSVDVLNLPSSVTRRLKAAGVTTVALLRRTYAQELRTVVGSNGMYLIVEALCEHSKTEAVQAPREAPRRLAELVA